MNIPPHPPKKKKAKGGIDHRQGSRGLFDLPQRLDRGQTAQGKNAASKEALDFLSAAPTPTQKHKVLGMIYGRLPW